MIDAVKGRCQLVVGTKAHQCAHACRSFHLSMRSSSALLESVRERSVTGRCKVCIYFIIVLSTVLQLCMMMMMMSAV